MRISDWSSDVCSSDLVYWKGADAGIHRCAEEAPHPATQTADRGLYQLLCRECRNHRKGYVETATRRYLGLGGALGFFDVLRSEELRVGKEWVSPCRSRWSPSH